ncbi:E3 ubiquitin-protein ligase [Forsythia ovata]|uniref:E3 ubiquitin-protein ligase n=1 Tax=Forsythia ovata TaxID=205694 RepID=A0ABD1X2W0_9LAMI
MEFSCYIFSHIKQTLKVLFSPLYTQNISKNTDSSTEYRPSSSLVSLPLYITNTSIKNQLKIDEFSSFISRVGARKRDLDPCCAVCLNNLEACDKVRELGNCLHVFHSKCLDYWIDQGHQTCPMCRANLLQNLKQELVFEEDPWRSDRMVYLFGEDYVMST